MKTKYITTELHPELKEGVIFVEDDLLNGTAFFSETIKIDHHKKDDWVRNGYIKEFQEPKWTDEDMIDFLNFSGPSYTANYSNLALNEFKKKNNK